MFNAADILSAMRGAGGDAMGNVVGSVYSTSYLCSDCPDLCLQAGLAVPSEALHFDFWIMLGVAALVLPVPFSGYRIGRWEGAVFIVFYAMYLCFIIRSARNRPELLSVLNISALFLIFPMALLMIGTASWQLCRTRKRSLLETELEK